jgi:hypothetical protein
MSLLLLARPALLDCHIFSFSRKYNNSKNRAMCASSATIASDKYTQKLPFEVAVRPHTLMKTELLRLIDNLENGDGKIRDLIEGD